MSAILPTAYLNGRFLPIDEAKVPALDRGFLFGDGVYEVVPYFRDQGLLLDAHLDRLERSLAETGIRNPNARDEWRALLDGMVSRNGGGDQAVYVQVTRGADVMRDHVFPKGVEPTVFAMTWRLDFKFASMAREGIAAVTATDIRWRRCDIKSTSLQANCMLREKAAQAGAVETILLADGVALEGAATSLFVVKDGELVTTPNSPHILPGTTRDYTLQLARKVGLPSRVAPISESALRSADEVWLTAATKAVAPVTLLDGKPVGDGRPGPWWQRLIALFGNDNE